MKPLPHNRLERFLLIVLLANLAIAQPLFDLLGRQAEFLVAHAMSPAELTGMALTLSILIPVMIALLPLGANRIKVAFGDLVFYLIAVALVALFVLPVLISLGLESIIVIATAVTISALAVVLYHKAPLVRMFFIYMTPAILIFPVSFLFFSRAAPLTMPDYAELAQGPASLSSGPDIVFVVLDEFPLVSLLTGDLEIDRQRYPNFARLADQANWYLAATTGAVVTVDAVPRALTGNKPAAGTEQLPIAAHYPRNLFTLLQDSYQIIALETATRLCPRQVCSDRTRARAHKSKLLSDLVLVYSHIVTPAPWVYKLSSVSNGWSGFGNSRANKTSIGSSPDIALEEAIAKAELAGQMKWQSRSDHFRDFIDSIQPAEKPGLFYLHSLLPHRVWRFLPDGRQYLLDEVWAALDPPNSRPTVSGGKIFGHRWQSDELAVQMALQRHILQVRFVDRLIGELLDHLQDKNMFDNSLIVVMGDHGASFVPGQARRMITAQTLSDISAVPLFIKLPGQKSGKKVLKPASLVDILPTIVEVLGNPVDWQFSGVSLLDESRQYRETISVSRSEGSTFSYSTKRHMAHLEQRAKEHEAILGLGTDPKFYRIGPHSELIGTRPSDHPSSSNLPGRVFLDAPEMYRKVKLDSNYFPLHITGRLESTQTDNDPVNIAIAVNGVIQTVSRSYDVEGFRDQFAALLPPEALQEGENKVQVLLVTESQGQIILSEFAQPSQDLFELLGSGISEIIADQQGNKWASAASGSIGQVLSIEDEGGALIKLIGSVGFQSAPESTIVIFSNGQFAASTKTVDTFFNIPIAGYDQGNATLATLRVFALSTGSALELAYPAPCSDQWHFSPPADWLGVNCSPTAVSPLVLSDGRYQAKLDFRNISIRAYMGRGWDFDEGKISWATGQQADLVFPLPARLKGLSFTALVQPFLAPPELSSQQVFLLANGEKIASWRFEEAKLTPISWEVSPAIIALGNGALKLSFLMPDADSPKSLAAGEDLRILGLSFLSMNIEQQ